ncbi:MAG: hypothetical protein ABI678_04255 [Kofleriaceae bacterium]
MRLTALLLLTCCDAGRPPPVAPPPSRHVVPSKSIDLGEHVGSLPVTGITVLTTGMDGYMNLDVVDSAKQTLTVIVEENGERRNQLVPLDRATSTKLTSLAERAWRETPHGDMPHAFDIMQSLYITDHDDAFELHAEPISDQTGHTGRPDASALVLAIEKLSAPALEPPPSRHPHAIPRTDLGTPDLDLAPKDVPKHGAIVKSWGMGGDRTIIVDHEAGTVRVISNLMGKPHHDTTRKVAAPQLAAAMAAAIAAWAETPDGEMPTATDVREDLYVLDDDEAFYLSGHPIGADGTKGRPLAQAAKQAIYQLAR